MNEKMLVDKKQIPNLLTTLRITLAVGFPVAPASFHLGIILIALLTEFLDGFIARLFLWSSPLGELLDPIADKLFFLSVCITWVVLGKLSWFELFLLGAREIGIVIIAIFLLLSGNIRDVKPIRAKPLSKVTTTLQYAFFLVIAFGNEAPPALLMLTAVTGFLAAAQYVILVKNQLIGCR